MNEKKLYWIWGGLFLFCGALGFVPTPAGWVRAIMLMAGLGFFVPPGLLLYQSIREGSRKKLYRIFWISATSLVLTMLVLVLNLLSIRLFARVELETAYLIGNILAGVLTVVASPISCFPVPVISIFLWACLLMVCLKYRKRTK